MQSVKRTIIHYTITSNKQITQTCEHQCKTSPFTLCEVMLCIIYLYSDFIYIYAFIGIQCTELTTSKTAQRIDLCEMYYLINY